ncbi:MAG: DUF58 domain-containing protein [Dehalococcoidia bacterium]
MGRAMFRLGESAFRRMRNNRAAAFTIAVLGAILRFAFALLRWAFYLASRLGLALFALGRLMLRPGGAGFRVIRRHHNLFFVGVAFGTTVGLAIATGHWMFYRASYVLGALVPLCLLWAHLQIRGLEVTVDRTSDRLQVGQELEARVRMKSRSMFTKLMLELEDRTDMPGEPARTVVTVPAKSKKNWKVQVRCERRGAFTMGPVRVTAGDPFGLFRFGRDFGEPQPLLVLPKPEELPYFWSPSAQLPGEGPVRKRTHYVTPNAAAIREYYPGDSYNRIHWRSTARLGRLIVKTFEMDPTSNIWVALDMHGASQVGTGDEGTEEYGVRVATSLAHHFLEAERMLGLIAHGTEKLTLDPARGSKQYGRILEALATARAGGDVPLSGVLEEEARAFGRNTTLIVVTPSVDEAWLAALQEIMHHGTRTVVVYLDPESFGGETAQETIAMLTATGILTYVVRAGSDIGLTLGPAGLVDDGPQELQKAGAR